MKSYILPLIACLAVATPTRAIADTVTLVNGDRMSGTVVRMEDAKLRLTTDYAGEIEIDWGRVQRMWLDEPLPVVLGGGAETELEQLPTGAIALHDVAAIAPSPPPARWMGRVAFGYAQAGGNSTTNLGMLTALGEKKEADRYHVSLLLDVAQGATEGEETANRARLQAKYDRRAGSHGYRYYLGGVEYDKVRDIDLRTELGAGFGRPLIDKPRSLLTADLGLSLVRDDLADGTTESDPKLRLGETWRLESGNRSELRQTLALLAVANDIEDYTAEFTIALTLPVGARLAFTTSFVDTYDSRPAEGVERNDYTVATQLGYRFGE
jgi:putative salt-induced outer membrane protein YdiY